VTLDASGSSDPEGLALRYTWDLDGNGSFETVSGSSPTVSRAYGGTTTFTARVQVSDPHGATGEGGAPVRVDSIPPVISALSVRRSAVTFRLSEPARVRVALQRRVKKRWRTVRVLRHEGVAGRNRLKPRPRATASKKRVRVRYRAEAFAFDTVGNRSAPVRRRVSAAAAHRLRRR
jgi:hypothetical protein